MTDKVFCRNCKFFETKYISAPIYDTFCDVAILICSHPRNKIDVSNAIDEIYEHPECERINLNNNCPLYIGR